MGRAIISVLSEINLRAQISAHWRRLVHYSGAISLSGRMLGGV